MLRPQLSGRSIRCLGVALAVVVGCGDDIPTLALGSGTGEEVGSTSTASTASTSSAQSTGSTDAGDDSTTGEALPEVPDEPYGSGSRLRAVVLDAPEGARVLYAFHDTELDLDCVFTRDEEGVYRCLPSVGQVQGDFWPGHTGAVGSEEFARLAPDCDTPTAVGDDCRVVVGTRLAFPMEGECGPEPPRSRAYRVIGIRSDQGCADGEVDEGEQLFELEAIAPEQFVTATVVDGPWTRALLADDGAWVHMTLLDADGDPCEPFDGACVPYPAAFFSPTIHADGECSLPAGYDPSTECGLAPKVSVDWVDGDVYPVVGPSELWSSSQPRCEPMEGFQGFALGDKTSFDDLRAGAWEDVGDDRIVARHAAAGDGSPRVSRYFYDDKYEQRCRPRRDASRGLVCVRSGVELPREYEHLFADASCTVPVYWSPEPSFNVLVETRSGACPAQTEYTLHDTGQIPYPLYTDEEGDCVQASSTSCGFHSCYLAAEVDDDDDWLIVPLARQEL